MLGIDEKYTWQDIIVEVRSFFTSAQFGQRVGRCSRRVGSIHSASIRFKVVLCRKLIVRNLNKKNHIFFCVFVAGSRVDHPTSWSKVLKGQRETRNYCTGYSLRIFVRGTFQKICIASWYDELSLSHFKFKLNYCVKECWDISKAGVHILIKYFHVVTIKLPA